jgi:hypothetical protein
MIRKQLVLVGFFSVLGFAAVFTVATDALACVKITGGKLHYCSTTRTYGTWTGSLITGATQFGDTEGELKETTPGFFDAQWATAEGQSFACTHDNKPAFCAATVVCKNFAVGTCSNGRRTSKMMCPTTTGNGCTGAITVKLTGGAIFEDINSDTKTFTFAVDPNISTTGDCNQQFPRINNVLDRQEIGRIVQSCTGPWSDQDTVLSAAVRDDRNDLDPSATYIETTDPWVATASCDALPKDGFPTGACTNDGGAWITVGNPDPEESEPLIDPVLCAASAKDLTCGDQVVDADTVLPGPAPKECKQDSAGNCTCRCARCNKAGTLVNLGGGTNATFVLADPKGVSGIKGKSWAAICAVTVKGN